VQQRVDDLDAGLARHLAVCVLSCGVRRRLDTDAGVRELRIDALVGAVVRGAGRVGADENLRRIRIDLARRRQEVEPILLAHPLEELLDVPLRR